MRQPLVTMMRMASALIQCVTRTTSGWILTHWVCDGSMEGPVATVPPWSGTLGYTLQSLTPISLAKAQERGRESPVEGDGLVQLALLRGAHQTVRLIGERQERRAVLGRRARHHLGDAAVDQELRLARIAGELEPARSRGRRGRAEIDVAGDVLQPRKKEGIGVCVLAIVAHERALSALRMVVLLLRKAVVDEQGDAFFQHAGEGAQKAANGERDFGAEAFGKIERTRGVEQLARGQAPGPVEALAAQGDSAFLDFPAMHADDVDRHG